MLHLYPRSTIDIYVQVLQQDGGVLNKNCLFSHFELFFQTDFFTHSIQLSFRRQSMSPL
jgi:hypothetical protein